jgi:hypothetical protein
MHEHGAAQARPVERLDGFALKADPFVAFEHGFLLPAIAASDAAVSFADGRRDVSDFVAARLAGMQGAAERIEGLQEKRPDEIGLKAAGFRLLHLLLHREKPLRGHRFLRKRVAIKQGLQVVAIQSLIDFLCQAGTDLGFVTVSDGFDEQVF